MLETVDFSLEDLPKDAYKRRHDQLTDRLVVLQQEARNKGVGLVVLFEGWNGAGKGSRISDLMYHLDARATSVHVTENLDVEAARSFAGTDQGVTGFFPVMQEFWKALGPRGDITFYDRGWYTAAMQQVLYNLFGTLSLPKGLSRDHVLATLGERRLQAAQAYVDSIADFERQLSDDGYVVVKFFVHMTKKGQKKRLMRLHDDPATRWRVERGKAGAHRQLRRGLRPLRPAARGQRLRIRPLDLAQRRGQAPHERRRGRDPGAGAGVRAGRPSRRRRWSCFKRLHGTVHAAFRACRRLCGLGCCARRHANRLIGRCVPARRASAPDVPVPGRARPPPPRRGGSFPGP